MSLGERHPTTASMITVAVQSERDQIVDADITCGFGHRSAEKLFEVRDWQTMPMLADRHDWWAAFSGELCLTLTIENAMRLTAPERATTLRTLLAELARLHSHLAFLSYLVDPEDSTLWELIDRLRMHTLSWSGNRIHPMLNRVGGLASDVPDGWLADLGPILDEISHLLTQIGIALESSDRFRGLAIIDRETCLSYGLTGPISRAAGLNLDVRTNGYLAYGELFTPVPTQRAGDAHARFQILIAEAEAAITMVRGAIALAGERQSEVSTRLSRRLKVPEGQHRTELEAPWGLASCFMVSRGGQTPWRVALRTPSFANLSALGSALRGVRSDRLADAIASIGYSVGDADK